MKNNSSQRTHLHGEERTKAHIRFLKEEIKGYKQSIKEAKTDHKNKPRIRFLRQQIDKNKDQTEELKDQLQD